MSVFSKATAMSSLKTPAVEAAMLHMLATKAKEEDVDPGDFNAMEFRVGHMYDAARAGYLVKTSWCDPLDNTFRREIDVMIGDEVSLNDIGLFAEAVRSLMDQIKIRGELFFFKLHKHFPKKLKQVHTLREGKIVVEFKNGRTVESHESRLDDREFLAECVMVHDL